MPYAKQSLRDYVDITGRMGEDEAVSVFLRLADAVEFAHDNGVVHRDIKPDNILELEGEWVLSDFGHCRELNSDSATLTRTGDVLGTVAWMAPEQFDSSRLAGQQSDIYSLGKTLCYMLTAQVPFPTVPWSQIPQKYQYVIRMCLADDLAQRYGSIAELRLDLEALQNLESVLTAPEARARELSELIAAGDDSACADLLRCLLDNREEEVFYRDFFPTLTPPVLGALMRHNPDQLEQTIGIFVAHAEGGHAWSWTDRAALVLEKCLALSLSFEIRRACLQRILILGYDHHRFLVREVFCRIVHSMTTAEDVMMVAGLLRGNPEAAEFVKDQLKERPLPEMIRRALRPE